MSVERIQKDRPIRHDLVEQVFVRIPSAQGQRPSAAANPFLFGMLFRELTHRFENLLKRRQTIEIALTQLDAATHEMHVRVVKTRQQHLALEINLASARPNPRREARIAPNVHNPPLTDCNGLGPTSSRINGVDAAAAEDDIRRLRRGSLGHGKCEKQSQQKHNAPHEHGLPSERLPVSPLIDSLR